VGKRAEGKQMTFNPLENDGDAFKLMIEYNMVVQSHCSDEYDNKFASVYVYDLCGMEICSVRVVWEDDPYKATREAIVKVAKFLGY
jgi:hypothetical protein